MKVMSRRIVLHATNCGKTVHDSNYSWITDCVIGTPLPTTAYTVDEFIERNIIGLYRPVTEEEVTGLINDPMFPDRVLHVFDWVGDFPHPDVYLPEVLTYPAEADGNAPMLSLSTDEYRAFVKKYTMLPACVSGKDYVGLYKERVKLRSE